MTSDNPPRASLPHELQGAIAQSRKQFVAAAQALRPRLHRFCARMCGSSLDGEDLVQETLADAFYNLASLRDPARFESWLFRIAYFKCVDFMRREGHRTGDVPFDDEHAPSDAPDEGAGDAPVDEALLALVGDLPPKERATVLLKDVLDYSLREIADIADSTLGGVKAALHRARAKLRDRGRAGAPAISSLDAERRALFEAYADCFNRRDWDALRRLVRADARLEIVGEKSGLMSDLGATYSGNYTGLPWEWRLSVAAIDGEQSIVHWKRAGDTWRPHSAIRLWWVDGQVARIRDYVHVGYLLREASIHE